MIEQPFSDTTGDRVLLGQDELYSGFHPRGLINADDIDQQADALKRAQTESAERLGQKLEPYAVACHAVITDLLTHPEDLLFPTYTPGVRLPKPRTLLERLVATMVKGILPKPSDSSTYDKLLFAHIDPEDQKRATLIAFRLDGSEVSLGRKPLCSEATFVETTQSGIADQKYTSDSRLYRFMDVSAVIGKQDTKLVFTRDIPRRYRSLTHLKFDTSGRISDVLYHHSRSNYLTWYTIGQQRFTAERLDWGRIDFSVGFSGYKGNAYQYELDDNGNLRRQTTEGGLPTIDQEIDFIISGIPITPRKT